MRLPGRAARRAGGEGGRDGVAIPAGARRAARARSPAWTQAPRLRPAAARTALLLNVAHALDHMFLLIFATAVTAIAADFGFARWEDLMPYGVGAFALFGLGSLPAGRLGDLWGRRRMMLVFFFGMGARRCSSRSRATPGSSPPR